MYSAQITSNLDAVIAAENARIQASPKLMNTAMRRNVSRLKSRMLKVRRVEPPPASGAYPLPFTTPKQRRAFFASKGFGNGIPYRRTHALAKAWDMRVEVDDSGGTISIVNDNPAAEFVYGVRRQPMFDKIGWLDPKEQDAKDAQELEVVVTETWHTIADIDAGVSRRNGV